MNHISRKIARNVDTGNGIRVDLKISARVLYVCSVASCIFMWHVSGRRRRRNANANPKALLSAEPPAGLESLSVKTDL